MSRQVIADFWGVSRGKVQAWDGGQRPSADDLAAIAHKLELDPAWLLLGKGQPTPQIITGQTHEQTRHLAARLESGELAVETCPQQAAQDKRFEEHPQLAQGESLVRIAGRVQCAIVLGKEKIPAGICYSARPEEHLEDWAVIPVAEPWLDLQGAPVIAKRPSPAALRRSELDKTVSRWDAAIWMPCTGREMSPEVHDGDMCLVDQGSHEVVNGRLYAIVMGRAVLVRRACATPDGAVWRAEHEQAPSYPGDSATVLGRIVKVCRVV